MAQNRVQLKRYRAGHSPGLTPRTLQNASNVIALPDATAHEIEEYRQIAERQVPQMTRLMDDLLDVARLSRGNMELRKKVIDVAQVVDRTVEACRQSIQGRRQHMTVTVPVRPLWIKGDAARIEQLITNFLNNAMQYTPALPHIFDPFKPVKPETLQQLLASILNTVD
jgi:signal transduction histidine kinase